MFVGRRAPSILFGVTLLVTFLVFTGLVAASFPVVLVPSGGIDISKGWLYKQGDDFDFRSPDLDDSEWDKLYSIEQPLGLGPAWYRLRVEIPESWTGRDVGLIIQGIYDSDWVYVNGLSVAFSVEAGMRSYVLPGEFFNPGQENLIALRVYTNQAGLAVEHPIILYPLSGRTNIVANGGFEIADTSGNGPEGWLGTGEAEFDTEGGRAAGGRAIRIVGKGEWVSEPFGVNMAKRYCIECYTMTMFDEANLRMVVEWLGGGNNVVGITETNVLVTDEWIRSARVLAPGKGADENTYSARIRFIVEDDIDHEIWIDDVSVVEEK